MNKEVRIKTPASFPEFLLMMEEMTGAADTWNADDVPVIVCEGRPNTGGKLTSQYKDVQHFMAVVMDDPEQSLYDRWQDSKKPSVTKIYYKLPKDALAADPQIIDALREFCGEDAKLFTMNSKKELLSEAKLGKSNKSGVTLHVVNTQPRKPVELALAGAGG